jgi:predicted DNA-binding transcriptional regulator AlpA
LPVRVCKLPSTSTTASAARTSGIPGIDGHDRAPGTVGIHPATPAADAVVAFVPEGVTIMLTAATMTSRPLTPADLAGLLGCSVRAVKGYVRRGKLPPPVVLSRRRLVWSPEVISQWLAQGGTGSGGRRR